MKKFSILFSIIILLASFNANSQNQLKRYDVKSGIIKYKTVISGKTLGSVVKGSGTEELYFKDWGAVELREAISSQTSTMKIFGKEKVETSDKHEMNKIDDGKSYIVDFDRKIIMGGNNLIMGAFKETDTDAGEAGMNALEGLGGEIIGTEKIKGYQCEIWSIMGGKQWMHKGVMLKLEITVLGITTLTEATEVKFNTSVPDANFKLPDFPFQETESHMGGEVMGGDMGNDMEIPDEDLEKMEKMSFEEWKKMAIQNDPETKEMSEAELRFSYKMMQKMIKLQKNK